MLLVGVLGLVVNLIVLAMLHGGAAESLNVKGAYLEVMADTIGSVGVVAAALLISWTGHGVIDTVVALAVGAFIAVRAVRSEEHTSELQSRGHLVCRLLLEKKKENNRERACTHDEHTSAA